MKFRTKVIYGVFFVPLFIFMGVIPLIWGLHKLYLTYLISKDTVTTDSIVVDVEHGVKCRRKRRTLSTPSNCVNLTYTYTTEDGYQITSTDERTPGKKTADEYYEVGDPLQVKYSRSNPEVHIAGYGEMFFEYFFGGAAVVLGGWMIVVAYPPLKAVFKK